MPQHCHSTGEQRGLRVVLIPVIPLQRILLRPPQKVWRDGSTELCSHACADLIQTMHESLCFRDPDPTTYFLSAETPH